MTSVVRTLALPFLRHTLSWLVSWRQNIRKVKPLFNWLHFASYYFSTNSLSGCNKSRDSIGWLCLKSRPSSPTMKQGESQPRRVKCMKIYLGFNFRASEQNWRKLIFYWNTDSFYSLERIKFLLLMWIFLFFFLSVVRATVMRLSG